jgi:hypothetical protein
MLLISTSSRRVTEGRATVVGLSEGCSGQRGRCRAGQGIHMHKQSLQTTNGEAQSQPIMTLIRFAQCSEEGERE